MTQNKQKKILVCIPIGLEKEFETYRKVTEELGIKSLNKHIWDLIAEDKERLFSIISTINNQKKGESK